MESGLAAKPHGRMVGRKRSGAVPVGAVKAADLGGRVQFISKPGEGRTVAIQLPARRGAFAKVSA